MTLSDLSCSCAQLSDVACFHPFRIPYLCHIGSQSGGNVFSMLLSLPVSTHMITVPVVRYSRNKKIGDKNSPLIYLLRPKPGDAKIYTIDLLASEIEAIGSLSVEDVIHVMKSFVRAMRKVLVSGDKESRRSGHFLYLIDLSRCGGGKGLYSEEYQTCQSPLQGRQYAASRE